MNLSALIAASMIQLTSLSIGEPPTYATVAPSYDGAMRDITRFYQPESSNFQLGLRIHAKAGTAYDIAVNTGHDTLKYDETPKLTLGMQKQYRIADRQFLTFYGTATLGGDIRHTPCYDDYDRQYHCGTLRAWSEFEPREQESKISAFIRYSLLF